MRKVIDLCRKNKSLIICTILFMILSTVISAVMTANNLYRGNISLMSGYFVRVFAKIVVSAAVFAAACLYGRELINKFDWGLVLIGAAAAVIWNNTGYIYSFEIVPFTNILAIFGITSFSVKYSAKSILYSLAYICMAMILTYANSNNTLTAIVFVLSLILAVYSTNSKKKVITVLNSLPAVILGAVTIKNLIFGIIEYRNKFYETGYMAAITRNVYKSAKLFGMAENVNIKANMSDYALMNIFGSFGYIIGTAVFAVLTVFAAVFIIKSIRLARSEQNMIFAVPAVIIGVMYILSMLANFSVVIYGFSASVPLLSDGFCGYAAIAFMMGVIANSDSLEGEIRWSE